MGTPNYMAPEQVRGDIPGPAADIYAVGCVAYRLFCNKLPYRFADASAVADAHLWDPVPVCQAQGLPQLVGDIVTRMLAKQPQHRPSLELFANHLRAWN